MTSKLKILSAVNYLMMLVFASSVAVQYNDPDPFAWIAIYGSAAVACVVHLRSRRHWLVPGVVGGIALIWSAILALKVIGQVGFGELFEAWEMKDLRVERAREMGGLLIIAAWMAVLVFDVKRQT